MSKEEYKNHLLVSLEGTKKLLTDSLNNEKIDRSYIWALTNRILIVERILKALNE